MKSYIRRNTRIPGGLILSRIMFYLALVNWLWGQQWTVALGASGNIQEFNCQLSSSHKSHNDSQKRICHHCHLSSSLSASSTPQSFSTSQQRPESSFVDLMFDKFYHFCTFSSSSKFFWVHTIKCFMILSPPPFAPPLSFPSTLYSAGLSRQPSPSQPAMMVMVIFLFITIITTFLRSFLFSSSSLLH